MNMIIRWEAVETRRLELLRLCSEQQIAEIGYRELRERLNRQGTDTTQPGSCTPRISANQSSSTQETLSATKTPQEVNTTKPANPGILTHPKNLVVSGLEVTASTSPQVAVNSFAPVSLSPEENGRQDRGSTEEGAATQNGQVLGEASWSKQPGSATKSTKPRTSCDDRRKPKVKGKGVRGKSLQNQDNHIGPITRASRVTKARLPRLIPIHTSGWSVDTPVEPETHSAELPALGQLVSAHPSEDKLPTSVNRFVNRSANQRRKRRRNRSRLESPSWTLPNLPDDLDGNQTEFLLRMLNNLLEISGYFHLAERYLLEEEFKLVQTPARVFLNQELFSRLNHLGTNIKQVSLVPNRKNWLNYLDSLNCLSVLDRAATNPYRQRINQVKPLPLNEQGELTFHRQRRQLCRNLASTIRSAFTFRLGTEVFLNIGIYGVDTVWDMLDLLSEFTEWGTELQKNREVPADRRAGHDLVTKVEEKVGADNRLRAENSRMPQRSTEPTEFDFSRNRLVHSQPYCSDPTHSRADDYETDSNRVSKYDIPPEVCDRLHNPWEQSERFRQELQEQLSGGALKNPFARYTTTDDIFEYLPTLQSEGEYMLMSMLTDHPAYKFWMLPTTIQDWALAQLPKRSPKEGFIAQRGWSSQTYQAVYQEARLRTELIGYTPMLEAFKFLRLSAQDK